MKCPYCGTSFHFDAYDYTSGHNYNELTSDVKEGLNVDYDIALGYCPETDCGNVIIVLRSGKQSMGEWDEINEHLILYPRSVCRPLSAHIPEKYANDFREAESVLDLSPKASAALSRRCLQLLLRDKAGVKPGKLYFEIEEFINRGNIPSYITDGLHELREIGNFAAHASKNHIGEILPVESGEAEWGLDILESLFDFLFVQPKKLEQRKNRLQEKLSKKPDSQDVKSND